MTSHVKKKEVLPTTTQDTVQPQRDSGSNVPELLSAPAHTLEADAAIKAFQSDPRMGLADSRVQEYAQKFGPNKLKETPPPSFWSILLRNTLNGECLRSLGNDPQHNHSQTSSYLSNECT